MSLAHAETHRWTIEEFERLYAQGFLPQEARVELIEGEIVHMPPMLPPHANAVMRATNLMAERFGTTHWIRVQIPINIPRFSQPQPDLALMPRAGFDESTHPTTADLLIEVADSSLEHDRGTKASLYARAGFQELWIVNLVDRVLEAYRDPRPRPGEFAGYQYGSQRVFKMDETVSPLMAPEVEISVKDFF